MGRRRCCCAGCWEWEDLFAREDSDDPGTNWNVINGEWGIQDEQLVEIYDDTAGTANSKIICKQFVPVRSAGEMFIEVEVPVSSLADGDRYIIWPCCQSTSTLGDIEVFFDWNATTSEWTVTIFEDPTTHSTYTTTLTGTPDNVTLIVCADHGNETIKAQVSPTTNENTAWVTADPGDGQFVGFGHNNTSHQNKFDNFFFGELRAITELCFDCFCRCLQNVLEDRLIATFVDTTGRATCLEGDSWELPAVSDGSQEFEWHGIYTRSSDDLDAVLKCGIGSAASFNLQWQGSSDCGNIGIKSADASSTCDPLYLLFGPYAIGFASNCDWCYSYLQPPECVQPSPPADHTLCSGEFWIAITEPA